MRLAAVLLLTAMACGNRAKPAREDAGPAPTPVVVAPPAPAPPDAAPAVDPAERKRECSPEETSGDLPRSTLRNTLSEARVEEVLAAINDVCGDTWCEGHFDYYFHGLRCDTGKRRCDIDVRMYDAERTETEVEPFVRRGKRFTARVLAQAPRECCGHPGITDTIEGCTSYDARCELQITLGSGEYPQVLHDTLTACLNTLSDELWDRLNEAPSPRCSRSPRAAPDRRRRPRRRWPT